VYTDFKILKVKVPIIFPARRVFRYAGIDVSIATCFTTPTVGQSDLEYGDGRFFKLICEIVIGGRFFIP
jgi:hypothetical protein